MLLPLSIPAWSTRILASFQADTASGCHHQVDRAVEEVVHSHSADHMVDFAVAVCMAAMAAFGAEEMAT